MNKINLHYAYWLLIKSSEKLSVWGLLGISILVGSLIFYFTQIVPLQQKIDEAKQKKITQDFYQKKLNYSSNKKVTTNSINASGNESFSPVSKNAMADPAQELIRFNEMLADGASLPSYLSSIDQAAVDEQLILNRGDYKLTKIKQGKTLKDQSVRYEIILPVTGEYAQIRQFIGNVLQQLPSLALSDMQINRESTLKSVVEAKLVFVLFLKDDFWSK